MDDEPVHSGAHRVRLTSLDRLRRPLLLSNRVAVVERICSLCIGVCSVGLTPLVLSEATAFVRSFIGPCGCVPTDAHLYIFGHLRRTLARIVLRVVLDLGCLSVKAVSEVAPDRLRLVVKAGEAVEANSPR